MPKHLKHKEKPQEGAIKKKALKKLAPEVREALKKERLKAERREQQQTTVWQVVEPPVTVEKIRVGRAILLAHGAGGSSSHASMKAWKQRLSHLADAVIMVDFARPYKMGTQTAAYLAALRAAKKAGHTRAVLVGVGMGAQVALHLLSGVSGDTGGGGGGGGGGDDNDGNDEEEEEVVAPVPALLRELMVGVVGLGLPLLKIGSSEPRDAALRALPADSPPVLLVSGSADPRMSLPALDAARTASAGSTTLHVVEGADAALRLPSGTALEKESTAALDTVLGEFLGQTLGSAAEASREIWAAVGGGTTSAAAKMKAKAAASTSSSSSVAAMDAELEERQRENLRKQIELKQLSKEASRAEQEVQRQAKEAARAAAKEAAAAKAVAPVTPNEIVVSGCGSEEVNGTYRVDGMRDGVPSYRIVDDGRGGPSFTIERDSAPDQATQFCLCVDFGFVTWCFVDSAGDAPPATGWQVGEDSGCQGPPPTLAAAPGSAHALPEAPEEPDEEEEEGGIIDDEPVPENGKAASVAQRKRNGKASKAGYRLSRGIQKKLNGQRRKARG